MPARYEIRGTQDLREVSRRLRAAGQGKVTRQMAKRMRENSQPAVNDAQSNIRSINSSAGGRGGGAQRRREYTVGRSRSGSERVRRQAAEGRGLRESIARAIRTRVTTKPSSASVRIEVDRRRLPPDQHRLPFYIDQGSWRHPVFGNDSAWVQQRVRPDDWWDSAMDRHGPRVRNGAVEVVNQINRDIARG
ncbi:hypothetical protein SAMN04487905_10621 [Actinopolyspora xinjiangensis]|uniref:Uncharacterized protein n=1 Tax=Actinopolyspora xinjiangensis TaxID=405564 RepID=A0A1H0U3X6_9ACTN|nr:hypothetical protein [Actinopolyspora xinjiangensis]SDP60678.1 hypothetical protein SAMN04487905_10621 [Actinopolyspora xinjiangensis]